MKKIFTKIMLMIGVIILLNACNDTDNAEVGKRAKEVAVQYMKNEKNINFVPKDVEITSAIGEGTVWVDGYNKDEPNEKYSVTINYENNKYSVGGVGSGDEVKTEEE